jgi:hypothetical protein
MLTMQGGKKGLLVNSRDICAQTYRSIVKMTGQNDKRSEFKPAMSNSRCKKAHKKSHHGHKRKGGRGKSKRGGRR